CMQALQTPYSL
nr:immunoglobulin light chain junction region [Macaca mulatta]MPN89075.1 immunoglobulin light chain junction region [Macaca mulatta]